MQALRRRVPFKLDDLDIVDGSHILDEQEQDELVERLRNETVVSNKRYIFTLRVILSLASVLQLLCLLSKFEESPLNILFPAEHSSAAKNIPFPKLFTLLGLFLHLNLALLFHPNEIRSCLQLINNPHPLSYKLLYPLAAVAPTLSLFLRMPWQTTVWWCFTAVIVFIVQTIMDSIDLGNQSIADLETLKYFSPSA